MASITKTAKGYRAQIYVKGVRDSGTFRTKREADAWASSRETELREKAGASPAHRHTFAELLNKYRDEVTPHQRGKRWEEIRIEAMLRDPVLKTVSKLSDVGPDLIGEWRNHRMAQVQPGTVLRELGFLSGVFEYARRELRWVDENPIKDVRKPAAPDHRRVLISRAQIRKMLAAMGYQRGPCRSVTGSVAGAFLLALRTGMRAGELCGLRWAYVFEDHCTVTGDGAGGRKTAAAIRDVPLTPKAKAIIDRMRGFDPVFVFGVQANTLDAMFRKYRKRAGLEGFTFHDSRHTAATWLARKLHILDLCLMFGWSNTKHALIYFNAPAADIAKQLSHRPKTSAPPGHGQSR